MLCIAVLFLAVCHTQAFFWGQPVSRTFLVLLYMCCLQNLRKYFEMEENQELFKACRSDSDCPSFSRCVGLDLHGLCIGHYFIIPGKCLSSGFGVCAEFLAKRDCGGFGWVCDNKRFRVHNKTNSVSVLF